MILENCQFQLWSGHPRGSARRKEFVLAKRTFKRLDSVGIDCATGKGNDGALPSRSTKVGD